MINNYKLTNKKEKSKLKKLSNCWTRPYLYRILAPLPITYIEPANITGKCRRSQLIVDRRHGFDWN